MEFIGIVRNQRNDWNLKAIVIPKPNSFVSELVPVLTCNYNKCTKLVLKSVAKRFD